MKITNEFVVHTPIDKAWEVLTDLEGIAPCMPGAQLTGVEGEVYKGKVKVKVGPVISDFAGTAQFTAKDDAEYRAVIDAKGRDARSAGNAAAVVTAWLTAEGPDSTKVSVDTDLKISGKLAQFGSGMIKEVSGKLLTQFVANLEAKLASDTAEPVSPAPVSPAPVSSVPVSPAPVSPAPVSSVPDPSAGEVDEAAGRVATAAGTPDPIAPLNATDGDVQKAADIPQAAPRTTFTVRDEPAPIDLLDVAGSSVYKRALPVIAGAAVVVAAVVWFVARR
ncbi:SRPBCC domain-containing protein [Actinoplanes sp. NBRC 101535]|uniref:SRPBCC family protein n=1 Tax=Actinoplanes sp. NBRC 101535 TaxID=3032196 RepID=UPI0024A5FDDE|nr:SRPBCC domain-containing protein [Actinoplanes sp. NBRC 101535]GLX99803.1 carbon monoxide dehydrogenase subunit G family protein [Actinoplanes sp. NBRC 101535]